MEVFLHCDGLATVSVIRVNNQARQPRRLVWSHYAFRGLHARANILACLGVCCCVCATVRRSEGACVTARAFRCSQTVLQSDNEFRRWRAPIGEAVWVGVNHIAVTFSSSARIGVCPMNTLCCGTCLLMALTWLTVGYFLWIRFGVVHSVRPMLLTPSGHCGTRSWPHCSREATYTCAILAPPDLCSESAVAVASLETGDVGSRARSMRSEL